MPLKISIITPSFNCVAHIEHAILNVLSQGYEPFEHIVVDGGSTDGTCEVLSRYPHLKWISEPDRGQTHAMNKGLKMATGDVIVFLNGDDYFLPDAFNAVIPCFEQGAKVVVGKIRVEKEIGASFINDPKTTLHEMLRHWEMNAFPYNPVGYFCRKEIYNLTGGFNENNYMQDLEFLLSVTKLVPLTKIDQVLGVYRDYEDTITQKSQTDRTYWTKKHFSFLNKFLDDLPGDLRKKYESDRSTGYRQQRSYQYEKRLHFLEREYQNKQHNFMTSASFRLKRLYLFLTK
jgi:glycosyltransferase involved in cell wall biosynthesis